MKAVLTCAFLVLGVLTAGTAQASADLANTHCGKCHEMDKKKKGPSYKAMAAKYKGSDAAALKAIEDPKNDHPESKAKPEELRAILKWVVQQQ